MTFRQGRSLPSAEAPGHGRDTASGSTSVQVAAAGAWGLAGRMVMLIANFVATPFLIRLLGPSRYGLWALLQTSVMWAWLADIGMATASTKLGSECYAHRDDRGESTIVWTALGVTGVATACIAVIVALEAPAILAHVMHARGRLLSTGVVGLRLVCALFVAQAVAGTVNTPQVVRLRWRDYTLVTTSGNLIMAIGAPVALVVLSGGVVTVAAVALGAAVFGAVGNLILAVRAQPALRRPSLEKATLQRLLAYGGALAISSLASIPLTTAERFFLAHNHSTTVVAYYGVAATVGTVLYLLPAQLVQPLLPGLAKLEAQGRFEEHRALYRRSLVGLFLVVTPAAMLLAFLAHPFLSFWAGRTYGLRSTGPVLIIIAGVWLNCLAWVPNSYLLSSGRTKLLACIDVAQIAPYLLVAWILTGRYGVIGAALVWSGRLVVQSIVLFIVVRNVAPALSFLPLSDRRWRSLATPVALGCLLLGAAILSSGAIRFIWAGALGAAYLVVTWCWVLTTAERAGLSRLFGELMHRSGARRSLPAISGLSSPDQRPRSAAR